MANFSINRSCSYIWWMFSVFQLMCVNALPTDELKLNDIASRSLPLLNEIKPRIVNGQNSVRGQFPHQALLKIRSARGTFVCGGTLLNNQWILTAAHCAVDALLFEVDLGVLKFQNDNEIGRVIQFTAEKVVHPQYSPANAINDLALIKLRTPVTFTTSIRPVKLPAENDGDFLGKNVIASGWGLTSASSSVAGLLQFAPLHIIPNDECLRVYGPYVVRNTVICAQGNEGESVCNGDSGGPLITDDNERLLVGVTSFGHQAGCDLNIPQGFSRVTSYVPWIKQVTGI